MAKDLTTAEMCELINDLSFRTAAALIGELQLMTQRGVTADAATSVTIDAAMMAARTVIASAVNCGAVSVTMPIDELLQTRLRDLLGMEIERAVYLRRADGSFDPVGQRLN